MIELIKIKNFALIDELEVEFAPGLNVLTGETGAGKSIIVGALNLVLGQRASSDVVRSGSDAARIEAVFGGELPKQVKAALNEAGVEEQPDGLFLSRTVSRDDRSRCYANGSLVTARILSAVGDALVDFHGQHEHQSLLKPKNHLLLLDEYGSTSESRDRVAERCREVRALDRDIERMDTDERERARQLDFLTHELNEIDAAELEPGEEERLRARRKIIANAEQLTSSASRALDLLESEDGRSVSDMVGSYAREIGTLAELDERLGDLLSSSETVQSELAEAARRLRSYISELEFDPAELDAVESRLSLLGNLKRKYGGSVDEILDYGTRCADQIEQLGTHDKRLFELRAERDRIRAEAMETAGRLSKKRHQTGRKLAKNVVRELAALGMEGAAFEVAVTQDDPPALTETGIDTIEFMLAANPGEALKPLRHVASGGEVSRIMLALKTVLARVDNIPTLIFDEIDAGVGSTMAKNVGGKLRSVSASHQVVCITHLPPIAAAADHHIRVTKTRRDKRSVTGTVALEGESRVEEIARLLSGTDKSDIGLKHARELMKEVKR